MISSIVSSGVTAIATNGDAAVSAITAPNAQGARNVRVVNDQAVAGFIAFDGGTTFHRIPASSVSVFNNIPVSGAIVVKRIAGGTDLTSIFVSAWA